MTGTSSSVPDNKSLEQLEMERAKFLIQQAFEEDENGTKGDAVELYMQAAELCMKLVRTDLFNKIDDFLIRGKTIVMYKKVW